jgi:uncharacterized membrane protein YcaP (DUF421 family)
MEWLYDLDRDMFVPSESILEMIARGSIMYLALFLLMRFVLRRETGAMSVTDVLVVVLIADAAQAGMGGEYTSIPEGLTLVMTILFWATAIDWLGYHVPAFATLVHPAPLELVRDGRILRKNLRQEMITVPELEAQLRQQGVEDVAQVKRACMEGDGQISVIKKDGGDTHARQKAAR